MIVELKKELSKLSGVDFFNPKYRDVFKKYFPNDDVSEENNTNEEERLKEVIGDETYNELTDDTTVEDVNSDEESENDDLEKENVDNEDIVKDDETDEDQNNEPQDLETNSEIDEDKVDNNAEDVGVINENNSDKDKELLETKVELELVKAGVREDRLESARKLFMDDIKSLNDLDKLKDLIKQYPEWLKEKKPAVVPFGMPLDNTNDGLTAEEKRLKAMGINPRD